jgi:hypothetical protein
MMLWACYTWVAFCRSSMVLMRLLVCDTPQVKRSRSVSQTSYAERECVSSGRRLYPTLRSGVLIAMTDTIERSQLGIINYYNNLLRHTKYEFELESVFWFNYLVFEFILNITHPALTFTHSVGKFCLAHPNSFATLLYYSSG